jgi:hypothetical protein
MSAASAAPGSASAQSGSEEMRDNTLNTTCSAADGREMGTEDAVRGPSVPVVDDAVAVNTQP